MYAFYLHLCTSDIVSVKIISIGQNQIQNSLLVKRQNDNTSSAAMKLFSLFWLNMSAACIVMYIHVNVHACLCTCMHIVYAHACTCECEC